MNAPAEKGALVKVSIPSLAMGEDELIKVLQSSIYPGAKLESCKLVIGYCRAGQLDPLQKPVHIVPMSVKIAGERDKYEWRDVIMPGVGLYRIQAARSGEYAGMTEPEFGPEKQLTVGDFSITYPEWCRVTVKRMVQGRAVEFTAKEFWLENYATAGKDTKVPNAMWKKRPSGQIAKCAEAQALRKAFPEFVSADATAEEMEGKIIGEVEPIEHAKIEQPRAKSERHAEELPAQKSAPVSADTGAPSNAAANGDLKPMTKGQLGVTMAKLENASLSTADFEKRWGCKCEEGAMVNMNRVLTWINNPAES